MMLMTLALHLIHLLHAKNKMCIGNKTSTKTSEQNTPAQTPEQVGEHYCGSLKMHCRIDHLHPSLPIQGTTQVDIEQSGSPVRVLLAQKQQQQQQQHELMRHVQE